MRRFVTTHMTDCMQGDPGSALLPYEASALGAGGVHQFMSVDAGGCESMCLGRIAEDALHVIDAIDVSQIHPYVHNIFVSTILHALRSFQKPRAIMPLRYVRVLVHVMKKEIQSFGGKRNTHVIQRAQSSSWAATMPA